MGYLKIRLKEYFVRFYVALAVAKFVYFMIRAIKHSGGTSLAGMIALKICPDFLKYCRKDIGTAINVTGTNGKTTTSGILAGILEKDGQNVIHNVKGANMLTGIANVFALKYPFKKPNIAVLESDEAYLTKLYDYFESDYLVVTNLFRDQLDRYGELSTTASFIQNAIDKNDSLILFLNSDDPLVSRFGQNRSGVIYYGFEEVEYFSKAHKNSSGPSVEMYNCQCGDALEYDKQFFAQEGHYWCKKCGYKRPTPDIKGFVKIFDNYSLLRVEFEEKSYEFKVNLVGLYNAYNALGAISYALFSGIEESVIKNALEDYKSIFGRTERKIINGNEVLIQLIKNPTGASEVLKTVDLNSNIVVAINDNYADGRDISWLWDADFEQLKDAQKLVITSGTRAKDMAVRLKYAGIPQDKIIVEENLKSAIEHATKEGNTTILPSYTALLEINKF